MSSASMSCQRDQFDLPQDVNYLNCAYQSPKLTSTVAIADQEVRRSARPWTISSEDFFAPAEKLRGLFARLIDARPEDVAIVPSCSYGIATAAANLDARSDEHIVVLSEQFPSNIYSWKDLIHKRGARLTVVDRPQEDDWSSRIIEAIDSHCAIAALPGVHWTDGYRLDLNAISHRCKQSETALVLDLTQSLGTTPFSVQETEVDFIAASSYKWLLGPLGLSFLYVNPRHHQGRPIEQAWMNRLGSEDFSRLVHYTGQYQPGAVRYDAGGRSNSALTHMATAALEQILEWGVEQINTYVSELTNLIAARADERGLRSTPADFRAPNILGIELPGERIGHLSSALSTQKIYASVRGNKLRISPYLYNSAEDIDQLFDVVDCVI